MPVVLKGLATAHSKPRTAPWRLDSLWRYTKVYSGLRRYCAIRNYNCIKVYSDNLRKELVKVLGRGMKKSEATYLFGISISSLKLYVRAWSIPSLAQGKHD